MKEVDNFHKGFIGSTALMDFGLKLIPEKLKYIVLEDQGLQSVPDGERLAVPSPFVISKYFALCQLLGERTKGP